MAVIASDSDHLTAVNWATAAAKFLNLQPGQVTVARVFKVTTLRSVLSVRIRSSIG